MKKWILLVVLGGILLSGCGQQAKPEEKPTLDETIKNRPRFELIAQDPTGVAYIDNQSININIDKTIASYWIKYTVPAGTKMDLKLGRAEISHLLTLEEILIGSRKRRIIDIVVYAKDGFISEKLNMPAQIPWENVIPNTNGEIIYNTVMNRLKESAVIK